MSILEYSKEFKREIRTGGISEQSVPTIELISNAIEKNEVDEARKLIDYFVKEVRIIYDFYTQWNADAEGYLKHKGMSDLAMEGVKTDLKLLANHRWNPEEMYDREQTWAVCEVKRARLIRLLHASKKVALEALEELKEMLRSVHDRDVDYIGGLFNAVVCNYGEKCIEEMYRDFVGGHLFMKRYKRFDVSVNDWKSMFDALLYVSFEAMRGHLIGPNRDGRVFVEEDEKKVVMSFAPCGSGGRITSGDSYEGSGPRADAPYYYQRINGAYDWTGGQKDVCAYCAHCTLILQKMPMEEFGYPVRVINPPIQGVKDRCHWTMYKEISDIPAEDYERCGQIKPGADELGSANRDKR